MYIIIIALQVISLLPQHVQQTIHQLQGIHQFISKAIEIAWEMVTLQPPMVISMTSPTFDSTCHDASHHCWIDAGFDNPERYPMYYLRPTLYHCFDGNFVAAKGWVGNDGTKL